MARQIDIWDRYSQEENLDKKKEIKKVIIEEYINLVKIIAGKLYNYYASNIEYDGCRRIIPRHRPAPAFGQQRRYKYVNQLRLYRNDIKRKPIYRSSGRTESARCTDPTANRGGCRSQFGSTGRSRTDSTDSEQRRQI